MKLRQFSIIRKVARKLKTNKAIEPILLPSKALRKEYEKSRTYAPYAAYILKNLRFFRKTYLSYLFVAGVSLSSYLLPGSSAGETLSSYFGIPRNFLFHHLLSFFFSLMLCCVFYKEPDDEDGDASSIQADWIEDLGGDGPRVAIYLRVSTCRQAKQGQGLEVQRDQMENLKIRFKPRVVYGFSDAKSGMDFDKRKINRILELKERRLIDELWVTNIDRIGRECRKLLLFFLNLCDDGVVIRTPERKYSPQDLASLLTYAMEAHMAEKVNKERAKRALASKALNFENKHWKKPVPLGYAKDGRWLKKVPEWTPIIKDTYDFFLSKQVLEQVRKQINVKYRNALSQPLARYHIRKILSDPIYVGKPEYLGKVVHDASLSYLDEKTFAKSLEILKKIHEIHKAKKVDPIKQLVKKYGVSALEFIDQLEYRHKGCGGKIVKNGTKKVGGVIRRIFRCKKSGEQWIVPSNKHLKKIRRHIMGEEVNPRRYTKGSHRSIKPLNYETRRASSSKENKSRSKEKKEERKNQEINNKQKSRQQRIDWEGFLT